MSEEEIEKLIRDYENRIEKLCRIISEYDNALRKIIECNPKDGMVIHSFVEVRRIAADVIDRMERAKNERL